MRHEVGAFHCRTMCFLKKMIHFGSLDNHAKS
jgi:hypothetical protein